MEDEGVFVGVVLDDVVVHVHQDPEEGDDWLSMLYVRRILSSLGELLLSTHPFLLFLYTLAIPSVGTPYFSDIYECLEVLVNRRLAAKRSFSVAFGHLQHPSSLWVWETSTSVRQTPHPSLSERTAVLWRRRVRLSPVSKFSLHLFTFGIESHKGNGSTSTKQNSKLSQLKSEQLLQMVIEALTFKILQFFGGLHNMYINSSPCHVAPQKLGHSTT